MKRHRPTIHLLFVLTCLVLAFNGTGALFGGYHLMRDPSGSSIQLPSEFLDGSWLPDYFIPGLALFFLIGIFSMVTLGFGFLQRKIFSTLVTLQGILLSGWLVVQVLTIREFYYLQILFGGIAIFFIFMGNKLKQRQINRSPHASSSL